jgi:hypothetical protein
MLGVAFLWIFELFDSFGLHKIIAVSSILLMCLGFCFDLALFLVSLNVDLQHFLVFLQHFLIQELKIIALI